MASSELKKPVNHYDSDWGGIIIITGYTHTHIDHTHPNHTFFWFFSDYLFLFLQRNEHQG